MNDDLSKVGTAVAQSLLKILYFIFVWPFTVWLKSVTHIADMEQNKSLSMSNIQSNWPLFTFYKRFFLDFLLDALSVLTYFVGVIVAFVVLIIGFKEGAGYAFGGFLATLAAVYYLPVSFMLTRDFIQFFIVAPLRKFVSWLTKPAQYIDVNAVVKDKELNK